LIAEVNKADGIVTKEKYGLLHWKTSQRLWCEDKGPIKFTIIRDPVKRFTSFFTNFFVDQNNPQAELHRPYLQKWGFYDTTDLHNAFDVLIDYAKFCIEISPNRADRHFKTQKNQIAMDLINYHYIFKIENISTEIRPMLKSLNIGDSLMAGRVNPSFSTFVPSRKQIQKLTAIYAEDYEAFNY
jgi:hypothetical protein